MRKDNVSTVKMTLRMTTTTWHDNEPQSRDPAPRVRGYWESSVVGAPSVGVGQTELQRGSQAAPLAATQDTSGEEKQDPCPVLQPLAQPRGGHLQPGPASADPLLRGRQGGTKRKDVGEVGEGKR